MASASASRQHRAFIALGSNLEDRIQWIEKACNAMDRHPSIKVIRTSSLWETKAMYVLDQENFINGACEIETALDPIELLDTLQAIENELGRVKVIEKGPRNIDLDILLYDQHVIQTERLQIPHKLMLEREFVLKPLCELIPDEKPPTTTDNRTFCQYLAELPSSSPPLSTLTPLRPTMSPLTSLQHHKSTQIMSIINLTPDSFSDGGTNNPYDSSKLQATVRAHIAAGATILDLGGQSTRPNATLISPDEEFERVLPAIAAIRALPEAAAVAISVDTFHASVAKEAVDAGAHIVNDVSAGTMDKSMLFTVAALGCTVCLMHMRGDPHTMTQLTSYPDGVVETVGKELLDRVREAEEAGIRRWRIILDPGLGFAKTKDQNLELLRRLNDLREMEGLKGFPWLVGPSRKGFVGRITGVSEARERTWGTAAAVSAAVQGSADIVRVHDVEEMQKVVKMADAIWRF